VDVDVEVEADVEDALQDIQDVRTAAEILGRNPILFKLDADDVVLRRKIAQVEAELESLDGREATADVSIRIEDATAQLATLAAMLEALDERRIRVVAEMDIDELRAEAEIQRFASRSVRIPIDLDIDEGRLRIATSRIANSFSGIGTTISRGLSQGFNAFSRTASEATESVSSAMSGLLGRAGRVLATVTQIGAAAVVIPVVGAAATEAWGALSATISTIPAAIALIGIPAATIALGIVEIREAFSSLKPVIDEISQAVSKVFDEDLDVIFSRLAAPLRSLKSNFVSVAESLVNLTDDLVGFITQSGRVAQVQVMFQNVAAAIDKLAPGIKDILAGFLSLASQRGAFDVLTAAVNAFGDAFKKNVAATILSGDLDRAFEGLEVLLINLARSFAGLVKNGIIVFANAAPGLNAAFRSISNFFGRFDWARLGREVGGVFSGLALALDDVDTETIRDIEDAFGELSKTFQSAEFRENFKEIVKGIGPAIRLLDQFADVALEVGAAVSIVLQKLDELQRFLDEKPNEPGGGILGADAKWWNDLIDQWDGFIQKVKDLWYGFTSWFNDREIVEPLAGSIGGGGLDFDFGFDLPTLPDFGDIDPPGLAPGWGDLDDAIAGFIGDATRAAATAVGDLLAAVTDGMNRVRAAFTFEGVGTAVGLAFLGMVGTVRLGMESIAQTVLDGMGPVNAGFNFESARTVVGAAFLGMVGTVTLGMQSIANAVLAGMPLINAAFNFASIQTALGLTFLGMIGTVNLGMQSIANAVLAGMPLVTGAFNFQPVQLNLGLAFLAMVGTVNLGMQSIANAVLAGMPLVLAAFNFTPVQLAIGLAFLGMVGTVRLGMESIAVAVEEGVGRIIGAISGGMGSIIAFWASNWALLGSIASGAWGVIGAVIGSGIGRAVSLVNTGLSQLVGLWRSNWSTVIGIVTAGASQVVAQFTSMVSRGLAALRTMVSGAAAVGSAIISGLVGAISAGAGRVISALRSLAERALAAARSALSIGSPSKAFYELGTFVAEGLALGMESGVSRVSAAAEEMTDAAFGAADKIADAFSGDRWAADFSSKVEHSFGEIGAGLSNKDVVGQLRNMNGTASQSTMLMSTMIAVLQAILAQGQGSSGGVALGAAASRQRGELGAF
jgi:hypothetical protein